MEKEEKKSKIKKALYYIIEIVIGIILIFATESFLSSINFMLVAMLSLIAVVQLIAFIMDKDYIKNNYVKLVTSIMCIWLALFIYKFGDFLFIELLPSFISLLLFMISTSLFTKYFELKFIPYLIAAIISIVFGVALIFAPYTIMYTLFKVSGAYIIIIIIFDIISTKIKKRHL